MNKREKVIFDSFNGNGWDVLHCGWPDFLLYKEKTNEAIFIEVKPIPTKYELKHNKNMGGLLMPTQEKMHRVLKNLGLRVKVVHVE